MGRQHLTEVERLRVRVLFFDACFTKRRISEVTGYSAHQVKTAIKEGARPRPRPGRPSKSGVQKRKEVDTRPLEPWRLEKVAEASSSGGKAPKRSVSKPAAQASRLADQGTPQASASADQGAAPGEADPVELDDSDSDEEAKQTPQPAEDASDLSQVDDDDDGDDGDDASDASNVSVRATDRPTTPIQPVET